MINTGWLCPRCQTVHAPDVKQCSCRPQLDVCPPENPWKFECEDERGRKNEYNME